MQVITQRSSSATNTTRAILEAPVLALEPSVGASSGSGSIVQPSIPFAERATERCEMPGRSSTRASTTVVSVELRRGRVEDDVDGIRPVVRGQDRVGRMADEELALRSRRRRLSRGSRRGRPAGRPRRAAAPRGGRRASTRRPRCRSSSPRRARRCSRRWRSRTAAGWSRLRPRNQSNDCCARSPCSGSPVTAKAASSASTNADASSGCSSPPPGAGSSRLRPTWPVSRSVPSARPRLVAEPAKRVEARLASDRPRPSATPPTISACGSRALS